MRNKRIFTIILIAIAMIFNVIAFSACDCTGPEEEKIPFVVTFNANGGTLVEGEEVQVVTDAKNIKPPKYVREGYEFSGFDVDITTLTDDATVKAVWTVNPFTIIFDANGGKVELNSITVNYGDKIPTLPIPTKDGYVFSGWKISGGENKTITQGTVYNWTTDLTVTAIWEEMTSTIFHITYNMNGGNFVSENPTSYSVSDPDIVLTNPERVGYNFLGWKRDGEFTPSLNAVIESGSEGDIHFIAVWEARTFSLTFDANGGTTYLTEKDVTFDEEVGELPIPKKEGFAFKGWKFNNVNGEILTSSSIYKKADDSTVIAVWEEIIIPEYSITYNLDGGEFDIPNPTSYKPTDNDITLNNPIKTGYTFKGWRIGNVSKLETTVTIEKGSEGDLYFTAVWEANRYKIVFVANGGTVSSSFVYVIYNENVGDLPIPEREGFIFKGWRELKENGKIIIKGIAYKEAGDTNVYAEWEEIIQPTYSISYDMGGADFPSGNPTTYKDSSLPIALINPEMTGYTFKGWLREGEETPKIQTIIESGTERNLSFTAIWEANEYKITIDANGGELSVTEKQVIFGQAVGELPTPTREGYNFKGYRVNNEDGVVIVKETIYNYPSDITIVAVWSFIPIPVYNITYNLNGGELEFSNPTTYLSTDEDIILNNPTKTGYNFVGWLEKNATDPELNVVIASGSNKDFDFTAIWEAVEYKIYLNANEGTVSIQYVTVNFEGLVPSLPTPERKGYVFKGWRLGSESGESIVQGIVYIYAKDVIAIAVWEEKPIVNYVITYDTDGAELPVGNPTSYTSKDANILLINPVKDGYLFLGWIEEGEDTPSTEKIIESGREGHLHFTAVWKQLKVKINYKLTYVSSSGKTITSTVNGQNTLSDVILDYGTAIKDYLFDFTPDTAYRSKCWVMQSGTEEVMVNKDALLTTSELSGLVLVTEEGAEPYYSLKLIAKVYSTYKVTIQTYAYVYNERIDVTINGSDIGPTFTVDYNESLGALLVDPEISEKDVANGIYFKYWYYLRDGVKVKVTNETIFNSSNFATEEIILIPQLYSYWTPIIPKA